MSWNEVTEFRVRSLTALLFSEERRKRENGCAACGAKPARCQMMHGQFNGEPLCDDCADTPPGPITKAIKHRRFNSPVAIFARASAKGRPCLQVTTPEQCTAAT